MSSADPEEPRSRTASASLEDRWAVTVKWLLARPTWVKAAVAIFLATIFQNTATPLFDASSYWGGATALAHIQSPWLPGLLELRGVWTSVLYLPAALLARLASPTSAYFFILLENAVAMALLGALLLPSIIGHWRPVTPAMTWITAGITWVLVGRYAPYALTDFLAAVFLLAAVLLLAKRSPWLIACAGALLFIIVNLRPAYLPVGILLLILAVWFRRRDAWPVVVGAVVAAVPQTVVNLTQSFSWHPWPVETGTLTTSQSLWASFFVRYDTIVTGGAPSVTWCDPHMARIALQSPPSSTLNLLKLFVEHLTASVPFVVEKFGAVLSWPVSAPYYVSNQFGNAALATIVIVITVLGSVCLASRRPTTQLQASVWAVWIGAVAVIVTSAPETRFSLPIVACGIVGLVARLRWSRRMVCVAIVIGAVLGAGAIAGLQHPIPVDATTAAQCVHA